MAAEVAQEGFPRRQYERPPVAEAIARLHWDAPIPWNVTTPGLLFERVRDSYPDEPMFQNLMQAEFGSGEADGPNLQLKSAPQKIIFGAESGSRRLVVGPTDISSHGLPPYEGWESLEQRLFDGVDRLRDMLPVDDGLSQMGIRYVNRIEIPETQFSILDFMTIGFAMPPGWPAQINAFFDRVECVYPDERSRITFTWATTEAPEGSSAFLVDLDLLDDLPGGLPVGEARAELATLKVRETAAFESLLQDRLRELFGEIH